MASLGTDCEIDGVNEPAPLWDAHGEAVTGLEAGKVEAEIGEGVEAGGPAAVLYCAPVGAELCILTSSESDDFGDEPDFVDEGRSVSEGLVGGTTPEV